MPPIYDCLIIGAGPAGLQLGYYLEKDGLNYLILEAGESAGTFFKKFPRHKKLISINKVYTGYDDPEVNLRWDWNSLLSDGHGLLFKDYSKDYFPHPDDLIRYLNDFAEHFSLKVEYGVRVVQISRPGDFVLTDQNGKSYAARRLVVATGVTLPYLPQVPGIELVETYVNVSVNPEEFANQRVLILGKGNSALETADNLIGTAAVIHVLSPHGVTMAWKTKFVGHLRAVNSNFLDTYQLKLQNALPDACVTKIERRGGRYAVTVSYAHAEGEQEELVYDRVIACTGWRFDHSIFDESCRPATAINGRFPEMTSEWESGNIKDLYFAGTLMQMRDFKKKQSGFIHGFRYNVRALYHIFGRKYHGREWPHRAVEATPEAFAAEIIRRVNCTSALWQQTGFLCDLLVQPEGDGPALYYEGMPIDYVHDSDFGRHGSYYVITLEFGSVPEDPFRILRHPDPERAELSVFLHPVIRRYEGPRLASEQHLLEDLAGEWKKEEAHSRPLLDFFKREMAAPVY